MKSWSTIKKLVSSWVVEAHAFSASTLESASRELALKVCDTTPGPN